MKQPALFRSPPNRVRGRVTDGLEKTLRALHELGHLEAVDEVWVALSREACAQYQTASRDPEVSEYVRTTMLKGTISAVEHLPIGLSHDNGGPSLGDLLLAAMGDTADTAPPD